MSDRLVSQASAAPTRKMEGVAAGGAVATVAVWVAAQLGVELPTEVAVAFAALIAFVAGYVTRERAP